MKNTAMPVFDFDADYWLHAHTRDGLLVVRRSEYLDDFGDYPQVRDYFAFNDLELVSEQVDEDDEYMMGFAVVAVYRLAAERVSELAA